MKRITSSRTIVYPPSPPLEARKLIVRRAVAEKFLTSEEGELPHDESWTLLVDRVPREWIDSEFTRLGTLRN